MVERALGEIHPDASLTAASRAVPWPALTRLFEAFGDIRGVGLSKTTKALHKKRPALIPILDSVVQDYLTRHDPVTASGSFAGLATALVRRYKLDMDRNRVALRQIRRELERHCTPHGGANPRPPRVVAVDRTMTARRLGDYSLRCAPGLDTMRA